MLPVLPRDVPISIGTGFPIRKSPDQSLLGGSPRLIAADRVLHRRLAPRHPPCTLSSLTTPLRRPCHASPTSRSWGVWFVPPSASRPWGLHLHGALCNSTRLSKTRLYARRQDPVDPASPVLAPLRARGRAKKKPRVPAGQSAPERLLLVTPNCGAGYSP